MTSEANRFRDFATQAEANAFIDGINYANTPGIYVVGDEKLPFMGVRVFVVDEHLRELDGSGGLEEIL